ncbi:ABC transporter substrate-binding protein [Paenibacillus protaetiae]|uniref:ABC transporter substrate-binding protein n=2 Tax=Paenibacillus protaetiae TaxID=2509456 RepID=A0A4P6EYI1_9BACL|nr:ABC transporter substrate-binding protein [Paenibacillus protaetiae]
MLILGACGTNNGSTAGAGSTSAGEQPKPKDKLTIMLDWYPNAVHSFLYAAQELGYFADEGLDVQIQMPADTNDALKLAAAGKVDLALSYEPQVLMARGEGIPVKSVGAVVRHTLNHLFVPEGGPIQSPKDLEGKTLGYSSIPLEEAVIRTMVQTDGGNPDKVKLVDVGFDLIPAIATKQTDAIIGGFINHEKLLLAKEGHPVADLDPAKYGVPDYYELVFTASDDTLASKSDAIKRFMAAAAKGQQYVKDHPAEGLGILLKHEDKTSPLDKDVETESLQILLPLMDAGDKPFGYQDPESWAKVQAWLQSNGLLDPSVKAEDAFVNL